jgi:hypothetical protein
MSDDKQRPGGLISDAQGEFVKESPGGAFDPRAFHGDRSADAPSPSGDESGADSPPMDGTRMSSPGEEIDKAG